MTHVDINGAAADVATLHRAATRNYGHCTSMQVRGGAVPGLPFHLSRLREGSATLFPGAVPPSDATIVTLVGHALQDRADASVRVTVLPTPDRTEVDVMVSVSDPVDDVPRAPLKVRVVPYEREMPHLKHVSTMGLTFHALQARRAGFDDVLLTRRDGTISEGSVWNVVFLDGDDVVWPEAPMLAGITMQALLPALTALGVRSVRRRLTVESLRGLRGAAALNSHCPAQPLATIGEINFPDTPALTGLLRQAWQAVTWQPLLSYA